MGVRCFYSWLVEKYPNIVAPAPALAREEEEDEPPAPAVGRSKAGPDSIIYDNLYLDMNEIIHHCFQPEDHMVCPPTTFDEVFQSMFDYMDRLFRIVRPRRLLYVAVDGVAPWAKIDNIRAARFSTSKAAKHAEVWENLLRERFRAQGKEVLPRETCEVSDPNVITPGTEFMEKLSEALEYYVRARLNTAPGWEDIKVILSDANVPGEGEHKIVSFIRAQRSMENYDPNTRHCLYGHDADLIMLALASHEVHISVLREVPTKICREKSRMLQSPRVTEASPKGKLPKKPYQFLNIWVLREYLELEMKIPDCKHDTERLIDDFIFICFLVGNDFIPRIPSLEVQECAIDLLIEVYKTTFNKMGGYIVNTDKVNDKHTYLEVSRLEKFFHELSLCEEENFLKRYKLQEKFMRRIQRQAADNKWNEKNFGNVEESPDGPDLMAKSFSTHNISTCSSDKSNVIKNTLELRKILKDTLHNKKELLKNGACKHDSIRLGLPGWKARFYRERFGAETSNEVGKLQDKMVLKYLEGLCWVLRYYFSDVPSWSWYYPFHYAPFASDLKTLSQFKISFTMGKPPRPFDELMAVLPPESSYALPKCYRKLMDCEEPTKQMFDPSGLLVRHRFGGPAPACMCKKFMTCISNITCEIGGWLSPDDDARSNHLFHSPIKDLPDITYDQTISAMFFNPEAVKSISRLLDNVRVPEQTITETDIAKRPPWHTYPNPRPPLTYNADKYSSKPDALWKSSLPAMPRVEIKNAGMGWIGRGKGSVVATDTQQIGRSRYGSGGGNAVAAETQERCGSYMRGFHGVDMGQSRGSRFDDDGAYSFRPRVSWAGGGGGTHGRGGSRFVDDGAYSLRPGGTWGRGSGGTHGRGSAVQKQQAAWWPDGSRARGGGGSGNGDSRGESGQPRA